MYNNVFCGSGVNFHEMIYGFVKRHNCDTFRAIKFVFFTLLNHLLVYVHTK